MKISPITNAYRRNLKPQKQINFGTFADQNAKKTVEKAFGGKDSCTEWRDQMHVGLMEEADFIEIYTDKDGSVKGKFFIDKFPDTEKGKNAKRSANMFIRDEQDALDDLSTREHVVSLGLRLFTIDRKLADPDPELLKCLPPEVDYDEARRARDEARIMHLLW